MAMTLGQLLNNGGVLRFRPPHGFYVVRQSERHHITQAEGEAAVKQGLVVPESSQPDIHGVWHFTLNKQKTGAKKQ